ncbi:MAG: hypothetical protein JXQ75_23900 [Phycisphaerae bacterium]|nr:hypothetical protein [Phycisphaerae bacterium]
MPPSSLNPRIFISVAEQSADDHAAALIRALRNSIPGATFAGLAGPAMRNAGCETFYDMTARSAMALATIRRVPEALRLLHRLRGYLSAGHFAAAVMVDSPTLNLPIAKICRRRGLPVLYYIAPQTWAWAAWRNSRIRQRVNRLACIWPFEEDYFRDHGIPATYVGHPSFDHLLALKIDEARIAHLRAGAAPVVTILPGSRRHVVLEVLPGQLEVANALKKRFPNARFLVVPASDEIRHLIDTVLAESRHARDIELLPRQAANNEIGQMAREPGRGGPTGAGGFTRSDSTERPAHAATDAETSAADRATAIRAADLVLVASGTSTLEVAYHGTPMIVMYNANRWIYHIIGRRLISTKYLSIPNILAGRRLVPEFMPYYRTTDPIIAAATEWLSTPATLARVRRELAALIEPIVKRGAAENAAAELADLIAEAQHA